MIFYMNNIAWKIEYVKPTNQYLKNSFGVYTLGCCDRNTQTIYISDRLRGNMLRRVLYHEITHAICFEYGIDISYKLEERLCNFMSAHGEEIVYIVEDLIKTIEKKRVV